MVLLRGVGVGGYGKRAVSTLSVEHDRRRDGVKAVESFDRELVGAVDVDVAHGAASIADHVVVVVGVGVEPARSAADGDVSEFPHCGEIVQGLVHGSKRDTGHLTAGTVVQGLGGRVSGVAVEQAEEKLALRRDLETLLSESIGQLGRGAHGPQSGSADANLQLVRTNRG